MMKVDLNPIKKEEPKSMINVKPNPIKIEEQIALNVDKLSVFGLLCLFLYFLPIFG